MSNTEGLTIHIHPLEKEDHTMTTPTKRLIPAALAAFAICLDAKAQTIDLSLLTADYTAQDGDVLTGSTAYGVIIPDGATVTLASVNVVPSSGPAISCAGDATILLADRTANVATGNPGVRLPDVSSKTLTITVPEGGDGSGALTATGNWGGAGIGNTYDASDKGNLCIGGGNITATGGSGSAGIGSGSGSGYTYAKVGTITISGGMVTATGSYNCSAIGRSASGRCGDVTIGSDVQKIVASNSGSAEVANSGKAPLRNVCRK